MSRKTRRRPLRKPGRPRNLRSRTVRRVLCQKGPQCKKRKQRRTRHRKRKQQRKTRTRRQRGGQVDEPGCKRRGVDWEWVPGARDVEFDRYYDCDLAVPGPGGCCRKMGAGQEKCPVCFDVFARSEMKPEGHPHKVCADCWEAIGTNQCPVCREQVGARPAAPAHNGARPDEQLRQEEEEERRREEPEPAWVRRAAEEMEMEQRREEQRELEERLREEQEREEEHWRQMDMGPAMGYDPMDPDGEGGGYWWWPF